MISLFVDTDEKCETKDPIDVNIRSVDKDKVDEAKYLLSIMMYYRKLCDDKASILLAIFGAVVTAIIVMGSSQIADLFTSLREHSGIGSLLIMAAIIISVAIIALGLFSLICTVNPVTTTINREEEPETNIFKRIGKKVSDLRKRRNERLEARRNRKKGIKTPAPHTSIIYFRGVSGYGCEEFKTEFKKYGNGVYLDDILEEVHITADVCVVKHKELKWGLGLSSIGIAALTLSLLIGFLHIGWS